MSVIIQSGTASALAAGTLTVTPGQRPAAGSTIIAAVGSNYAGAGATAPSVTDTAANTWVTDIYQFQGAGSGGAGAGILRGPVAANSGAPYSFTVDLHTFMGFADVFLVWWEVGCLARTQPDGLPTSLGQASGISIAPGAQTPGQAGDFAVTAFAINQASSWQPPGGTNPSWTSYGGASVTGKGDVAMVASAPKISLNPSWTAINPSSAARACVFALYAPAQTFSPPALELGLPLSPATISGKEIINPSPPLGLGLTLPALLNLPSAGADRPSASMLLALPAAIALPGTLAVAARALAAGTAVVLPPAVSFTSKYPHLQIRRGPLSFGQALPLLEGELYEAGVVVGSTVYTLLYVGGHDGTNKIVGGGVQATSGAPSFPAVAGQVLYDPTAKLLYVGNADGTWRVI